MPVTVDHYFIAGALNPADTLSRVFPPHADCSKIARNVVDVVLPPLASTFWKWTR